MKKATYVCEFQGRECQYPSCSCKIFNVNQKAKKLLVAILIFASSLCFSQKTDIDSLKIFSPDSHIVKKILYNPDLLEKTLDSLSKKEKRRDYNVVFYLKNDKVIQCTYKKKLIYTLPQTI